MTPRTQRIALAVHHYASQAEWNLTIADLAEQTGESKHVIRGIVIAKGWAGRLRSGLKDYNMGQSGGNAPMGNFVPLDWGQ